MNIAVLSNLSDEILPLNLKKLVSNKLIKRIIVILKYLNDESLKKHKKIFYVKTKGYFLKKSLWNSDFSTIDFFFVENHNNNITMEIIEKNKIDYLFSSDSPYKYKKNIIYKTKGLLNIHLGLLPYYRGSNCMEWSILNNDPVGLTAYFMDQEYDSGNILLSKICKIQNKITYEQARIKLYKMIPEMLNKTMNLIIKKNLRFKKEKKKKKFKKEVIFKPMPLVKLNLVKRKLILGNYKSY